MRLTSSHNPIVKHVRSLERAAVRRAEGVFVAEGVRLLREAHATGQIATLALFAPEILQRTEEGGRLMAELPAWASERYEVEPHVLKAASHTDTPSGALVVLKVPPVPPLERHRADGFGVILDTVSDPGNAGTIVRTALAGGAQYLVSTSDSVDLFSSKVVRAGMGAHFRLPLYPRVPWDDLQVSLAGVTFVAASTEAQESMFHFKWPRRAALVVGSEAHGLSVEAASAVQARVRIPMQPGVESLNAAIAAGILIYAARSPILSSES